MIRACALVVLLLPLPAQAAGLFSPPQGCRLEYTVQNRSCTVSNHYRCDADPEGWQRMAAFAQGGMTNLSTIDAETRWIESSDPETGLTDTLEDGAEDDASFSTLIATGRDDFDFWTVSNTGERMHHVGFDELTGEKVEIGGIPLEATRFELTTTSESGEVLIERTGGQFISRTLGRFFGGIESGRDWTGEDRETNDSPMSFAFPGQTGFGSTTPQYDCDLLMTGLPRPGGGA